MTTLVISKLVLIRELFSSTVSVSPLRTSVMIRAWMVHVLGVLSVEFSED
jgi:hypothetical protein